MAITTVTLLPYTEYGVPSGNYDGSSEDFTGDPQKAANYYRGRGSIQTIRWVFRDVQGEVLIQATLDNDPAESRWFDVATYGDAGPVSETYIQAVMGNFVWLRAVVSNFTNGTIEVVQAAY